LAGAGECLLNLRRLQICFAAMTAKAPIIIPEITWTLVAKNIADPRLLLFMTRFYMDSEKSSRK